MTMPPVCVQNIVKRGEHLSLFLYNLTIPYLPCLVAYIMRFGMSSGQAPSQNVSSKGPRVEATNALNFPNGMCPTFPSMNTPSSSSEYPISCPLLCSMSSTSYGLPNRMFGIFCRRNSVRLTSKHSFFWSIRLTMHDQYVPGTNTRRRIASVTYNNSDTWRT